MAPSPEEDEDKAEEEEEEEELLLLLAPEKVDSFTDDGEERGEPAREPGRVDVGDVRALEDAAASFKIPETTGSNRSIRFSSFVNVPRK